MELNNFSKNLSFLRNNCDLSQIELAENLGMSRQTISHYENEMREPSLTNIIKISKFFNCDVYELIFGKKNILSNKFNISLEKFNKINYIELNNFANNLIFFRIKNNLSQSKLARHLEISRETISHYENEIREPGLSNIIKISRFFNCDIDELIFNKGSKLSNKLNTIERLDTKFNALYINNDLLDDLLDALVDKKLDLEKMSIIIQKKIEIINSTIEYIKSF